MLSVLFWLLLFAALAIAVVLWLVLGDLTHLLVGIRRQTIYGMWSRRWLAVAVATALLAAAFAVWRETPSVAPGWVVGTAPVVLGLLLLGGLVVPRMVWRPIGADISFVALSEARNRVADDEEVIVVDWSTPPKAFPVSFLRQPHVAPVDSDGNVVTYCVLTNAAMVFGPAAPGQRIFLNPVGQAENNLLLHDAVSGALVQQIDAESAPAGRGVSMKRRPVTIMPMASFAKLHPKGQVFVDELPPWRSSPLRRLWDGGIRRMMTFLLRKHHKGVEPLFPLGRADSRLPWAQHVCVVSHDGCDVALTLDHIRAHGDVLNLTVGDRGMVIAYDAEHRIVSAFFNDSDGAIDRVDVAGNSDVGALERVPTLVSNVHWGVVANFRDDVILDPPPDPVQAEAASGATCRANRSRADSSSPQSSGRI